MGVVILILKFNGDIFKKIPNDQPGYYNWVGKESHYLTVVDSYMRVTEGKLRQRYFMCKCKCGNEKLVHGDGIRKQRIKSCGCWKSEVDAVKAKIMGDANKKHGLSNTRIYGIWNGVIDRCTNVKSKDYENYGGRGITVAEEWLTFDGFYNDMYKGYKENLTIDRIDVNGNYEPGNCRWITIQEQAGNRRNTIYLEYLGRRMKPRDWSRVTGLKESTIKNRINAKLPVHEILNPRLKRNPILISYNGKTLSPKHWSEITGISGATILSRYHRGWSPEKILTKPVKKS